MNHDQRIAIERVLRAQDYVLINGYPGTGKTSTLAVLIQILVAQGKRVLLTSFTHTAVDNVMLKLIESPSLRHRLLRLGPHAQIHPQ